MGGSDPPFTITQGSLAETQDPPVGKAIKAQATTQQRLMLTLTFIPSRPYRDPSRARPRVNGRTTTARGHLGVRDRDTLPARPLRAMRKLQIAGRRKRQARGHTKTATHASDAREEPRGTSTTRRRAVAQARGCDQGATCS